MATTINADTSNGLVITPDTSGDINLQSAGVTKASVTSAGLTVGGSNISPQPTFRNLVINGDMRIAQRGTSATGITSSGYYVVDRFQHGIGSMGTWSISQSTDVPTGQGFANSLKMDCTTADASPAVSDTLIVRQKIEGQMLQHLKKGTSSAEKVTVSFWVKSAKTGTYILELDDRDNTRHICQSYTIDTADTWEKKTLTFDGDTTGAFDSDNNSSLWLSFWLGAGTNFTSGTLATSWTSRTDANRAVGQVNLADNTSNYIRITGIQLEVGEGASDFEHLPYDVQLQRCQRYFVNALSGTTDAYGVFAFGQNNSSTQVRCMFTTPTQMRTVPSLIYSGSFEATGGAGGKDITTFQTSVRTGNNFMELLANTVSGGTLAVGYMIRRKNDSNAYFHLSAEL